MAEGQLESPKRPIAYVFSQKWNTASSKHCVIEQTLYYTVFSHWHLLFLDGLYKLVSWCSVRCENRQQKGNY